MFKTQENTAPETAQNHVTQADEVSSRLSQTENISATDQLNKNESLPGLDNLILPQDLKGHEANFNSFKQLAAELKLSADTAKKLVEWESSATAEGRKTAEAQRGEILERWTQQTKEFFGPTYSREIARALGAADRFGGPELRALLDATGLGSHPIIVKTFHSISKQISEDESIGGSHQGKSADKTFAEALYGKAA